MIGLIIAKILTDNTAIAAKVSTHVYPISETAEGFPSIYYKVKCLPETSKNGSNMDAFEVEILTTCNTYAESWPLAVQIKNAVEAANRTTKSAGTQSATFSKIVCISIEDDFEFQFDTYGQIIKFSITTNNLTA